MEEKELEKLYQYCRDVGVKDRYYKECADKVIASGSAKYNYLFAKKIPGADINAHRQAVIKSKDPEYNYLFAKTIPSTNAEIKVHEKIVIEGKNPKYCLYFALNVLGAYVEKHRQVIYASKDEVYIGLFIKYILKASKQTNKKNEMPKELCPKSKRLKKLVFKRNEVQEILEKQANANLSSINENPAPTKENLMQKVSKFFVRGSKSKEIEWAKAE